VKTDSIFFKSIEHKDRFLTAIQQIGKVYNGKLDPEYAAALFVLTSDLITWEKASGYVSRHGIDFDALLQEVDFSHAYVALIKLAGNLFNAGYTACSPVDLYGLDDTNFKIALSALILRRNNWPLDSFQDFTMKAVD
jgi:hypothetical protein